MTGLATVGDLPRARKEFNQALRRSKRMERAAASEIAAFVELRAQQSPWAGARRIRLQALIEEISASLQILDGYRRDLSLRLRLQASAVRAARAYAQARHHAISNMKG